MIAVSGATGKLGSVVIEGLLEVVPADGLVAIVRNPTKAEHFASRGVKVRRGDYSVPHTLGQALVGVKLI